jgi:hypothetical protein
MLADHKIVLTVGPFSFALCSSELITADATRERGEMAFMKKGKHLSNDIELSFLRFLCRPTNDEPYEAQFNTLTKPWSPRHLSGATAAPSES